MVVFGRTIQFDFLFWDDNVFIFQNAMMSLSFADALKQAFGSLFNQDYLPITMMSWWADCSILNGCDSQVSHFVNIAVHLTNVVLIWFCLRPLFSRLAVFFIVGAFALHPLQVETVAWASARNGLLCATFTFLAVLCAQRA